MHTFHATQPITASLELAQATVLVRTGDGDDVTVTVDPSNPSKGPDVRSAEQTRVEFSKDRLTVVQPKTLSRFSPFNSGSGIDVSIQVPRGSRIAIDSSYGSIRTEGAIGPSTIKTSYGDVTVDEGHDLDLRTGYGDVTVHRASGRTEIVGGKVRIAEVDGTATVKSRQDGTSIGIVTGPIQIASSYGDIEIDHVFAPVTAKTAYGKVRINDAVRGSIEMRSSYGALELGVRAGTAAWLDLDADHGTVRNALQDAAPPDAEEPEEPVDTVEVLGRTSWGDITIRRAVAAR